jgi:hypothetical protein
MAGEGSLSVDGELASIICLIFEGTESETMEKGMASASFPPR